VLIGVGSRRRSASQAIDLPSDGGGNLGRLFTPGNLLPQIRVVPTLAALFAAAKGVEAFAVTDIVQRMWEKLVHLSTAAAMTCLMRANVGEIVRTPNGRELFLDQLQCGAAIAAANGHARSEGFMRSWEETFSQRDSQYATSMLRDVERGGPTEVEHILGFMLNKASEANIAHRTLLLAYTHIKAFEQRRAAGGLP
jgi:2-dehydropantoate 2-reductase